MLAAWGGVGQATRVGNYSMTYIEIQFITKETFIIDASTLAGRDAFFVWHRYLRGYCAAIGKTQASAELPFTSLAGDKFQAWEGHQVRLNILGLCSVSLS
jgi:hypothetical protein